MRPKILAFAGSARSGSLNKMLLDIAIQGAREAGGAVTCLDIGQLPLPVYNADLERKEGLPDNAKAFKKLMIEHDAFLISSPEYNSSVSGVLKNIIDWVSRKEEGDSASLIAFRGKVAALMSASPSGYGGVRGLAHLRHIFQNIHTMVIPEQVTISFAHEAFNEDGTLKDEKKQKQVIELGKTLVEITQKLIAQRET